MIAIIDGDSLIYLSLPKKSLERSTYEDCVQQLDSRIHNLLNKVNATKYVICLTVGRCFRYKNWKYSSPYKNKRKNSQRPPIFYALEEYLKQNYNVCFVPSLEADDLVCVFKNEFNKIGEESILCSTDKDVIKQMSGIHYDYAKDIFVEVREEDVDNFLYEQMLTGDTTDNIEGIRGLGSITAKKLLNDGNHLPVIINEYFKRYPIHEAVNKFYETYTMVYILKSFEEVRRETSLELTLPKLEEIEWSEGERKIW